MKPTPADEARFATWMAEHRGIIAKISRSYTRTEREREDLAKELAYQIWLSAPRFAGQASAATWIYRVCLNTAFTWRRNAGRHERRTDAEADLGTLPSTTPGPAAAAEQSDLLDRVYDALHQLSELDRSLLLLQLDGLAYRDIAEVTGLTENHVGVALNRARQRLTAQMKGIIDEMA
jgi:RNA polymerase sigma-70 factor (ECF subfamily)